MWVEWTALVSALRPRIAFAGGAVLLGAGQAFLTRYARKKG